jgi:hypothetical protein
MEARTKDGKDRGEVCDGDGKAGFNRNKRRGLRNKDISRIGAKE